MGARGQARIVIANRPDPYDASPVESALAGFAVGNRFAARLPACGARIQSLE